MGASSGPWSAKLSMVPRTSCTDSSTLSMAVSTTRRFRSQEWYSRWPRPAATATRRSPHRCSVCRTETRDPPSSAWSITCITSMSGCSVTGMTACSLSADDECTSAPSGDLSCRAAGGCSAGRETADWTTRESRIGRCTAQSSGEWPSTIHDAMSASENEAATEAAYQAFGAGDPEGATKNMGGRH
jgi:hypothetical protein